MILFKALLQSVALLSSCSLPYGFTTTTTRISSSYSILKHPPCGISKRRNVFVKNNNGHLNLFFESKQNEIDLLERKKDGGGIHNLDKKVITKKDESMKKNKYNNSNQRDNVNMKDKSYMEDLVTLMNYNSKEEYLNGNVNVSIEQSDNNNQEASLGNIIGLGGLGIVVLASILFNALGLRYVYELIS